jgi:hypothetical protein
MITNRTEDVSAARFSLPQEVLEDPSLSATEKRAILCEWASDACAVPSFPALRLLPGSTFPVTFSAVMAALRQLDDIEDDDRYCKAPAAEGRVIPLRPRALRPLHV